MLLIPLYFPYSPGPSHLRKYTNLLPPSLVHVENAHLEYETVGSTRGNRREYWATQDEPGQLCSSSTKWRASVAPPSDIN